MSYESKGREGIEKRNRQLARDYDALLRRMGLTVSDKKAICDASTQYRLSTTSEGARAVEQYTTEATQETHRSFAETSDRVDDKQEESRNEERALGASVRDGRHDTGVINGTEYQLAEAVPAKGHLRKAGQKSKDDAHYCDTAKAASENKRLAAEKTRQSQKKQLENMTLGLGGSGTTAGAAEKEGAGAYIREIKHPWGLEEIAFTDDEPEIIDNIEDQATEPKEMGVPISQQELEAQRKLMQGQRREEPDLKKKPKKNYMERDGGYIRKVESYKGEEYK